MATYEPTVISQFAERLYARARVTVVLWSCVVSVLGFVAAGILTRLASSGRSQPIDNLGLFIGIGAGALIGYAIGSERAFALKFQAQAALCQLRIEQNTRNLRSEA